MPRGQRAWAQGQHGGVGAAQAEPGKLYLGVIDREVHKITEISYLPSSSAIKVYCKYKGFVYFGGN